MTARPGENVSARWADWRARIDLDEYDARWSAMAERGDDVHGEANAITRLIDAHFGGRSCRVLDAGCGTGRLAVELERRGHHVTGVDLDADMVDRARLKSSTITWMVGDLAVVDLAESFDVVVMAGNILNFCAPDSQPSIVANLVRHLVPGGLLVCGWSQESQSDSYRADGFAHDASASGATEIARWKNWDGDPVPDDRGESGDYAVVVVRRTGESGA